MLSADFLEAIFSHPFTPELLDVFRHLYWQSLLTSGWLSAAIWSPSSCTSSLSIIWVLLLTLQTLFHNANPEGIDISVTTLQTVSKNCFIILQKLLSHRWLCTYFRYSSWIPQRLTMIFAMYVSALSLSTLHKSVQHRNDHAWHHNIPSQCLFMSHSTCEAF